VRGAAGAAVLVGDEERRPARPSEGVPAMKACGVARTAGGVEVIRVPEPPAPGPGELLVEVAAAGVGAWDRLLTADGDERWDVGLRLPAALGVEGAGTVLAVGEDVEAFGAGDRVLAFDVPLPGGSGFWAERVLVSASGAVRCPRDLDPVSAAALPVNALAAGQALDALRLRRGGRLLVTNAGGNTGVLAVQMAVSAQVEVIATASEATGERLLEFGAAVVLDHHDPQWPSLVRDMVDAALAAAPGTAREALPLVRDGGRLCSLTSDAPAGEREVSCVDIRVRPDAERLGRFAQDALDGRLRMATEGLPLTEGPFAFARAVSGTGGRKLVLIP
jgi:NADPH:quinone reductase-like Zn-dependent oxidoreductase